MINENLNRIHNFDCETQVKKASSKYIEIREEDLDEEKFDQLDETVARTVGPPKTFLGKMKDY